jgi:osomolarity two-component system sensor histidine kinase SLN1
VRQVAVPKLYIHLARKSAGSFELVLSRFDSHSLVPTRTLGDPLTGTEYLPDQKSVSEEFHEGFPRPSVLEKENSSDTVRHPDPNQPSYTHINDAQLPESLTSTATQPLHPPSASQKLPSPCIFDSNLPVLVVDDDPLTRMLMKRMLTRMGCAVSTAENGETAIGMLLGSAPRSPASDTSGPILEQFKSNPDCPYSIVFMDNQMPVMSGLKAIKKLRELGRIDFVVGVTGKNQDLCSAPFSLSFSSGRQCALSRPKRKSILESVSSGLALKSNCRSILRLA